MTHLSIRSKEKILILMAGLNPDKTIIYLEIKKIFLLVFNRIFFYFVVFFMHILIFLFNYLIDKKPLKIEVIDCLTKVKKIL